MNVQAIFFITLRYLLAVPDHSAKHSYYLRVGYPALFFYAVISADNVIIFADLKHAVHYIFPILTHVQCPIIAFESSLRLFDDHKITVLSEKRHHTYPRVGIYQPAVALKLGFKR